MRIRVIQKIRYGDAVLHPGEVFDVDKKQADKWIKAGEAIAYPEEVTNGDGQNSPEVE